MVPDTINLMCLEQVNFNKIKEIGMDFRLPFANYGLAVAAYNSVFKNLMNSKDHKAKFRIIKNKTKESEQDLE